MSPKTPTTKVASTTSPEMDDLLSYTQRTQSLLAQLLESATSPSAAPPQGLTPEQKRLNTLHILRDSGKLLKAHTTKLSLMILNKPFGARSIKNELQKCSEECIMGMMGALDIMCCNWQASERSIWPTMLLKEARARVARVIREASVMVAELRDVAEHDAGLAKAPDSKDKVSSRDTLSSTGVVWSACDELIALDTLGIAGLAVQRVDQYHQTLKDAIAELKEWAEEDEEDDDEDDDDAGDFSGAEDDFDEIFGAAKKLPKGESELRDQLTATMKKLQLISVLFQALIKRRLKPFKFDFPLVLDAEEAHLERVGKMDKLLGLITTIPEAVDEVACAFYELDGTAANAQLQICLGSAKEAVETVRLGWGGTEDEFTAWSTKWKDAVEK